VPVTDNVPALIGEHTVSLQVIPVMESVELLPAIDVSPASALAEPITFAPEIVIFPNNCSTHDVPPSHPNTSISEPVPTIREILSAATVPAAVAFCIFIDPRFPEEHDMLLHIQPVTINDVPGESALMLVIPILS